MFPMLGRGAVCLCLTVGAPRDGCNEKQTRKKTVNFCRKGTAELAELVFSVELISEHFSLLTAACCRMPVEVALSTFSIFDKGGGSL